MTALRAGWLASVPAAIGVGVLTFLGMLEAAETRRRDYPPPRTDVAPWEVAFGALTIGCCVGVLGFAVLASLGRGKTGAVAACWAGVVVLFGLWFFAAILEGSY